MPPPRLIYNPPPVPLLCFVLISTLHALHWLLLVSLLERGLREGEVVVLLAIVSPVPDM